MAQMHHAELYNEALCFGRAARGDMSPESRQLSTRLAICTTRRMTFITANRFTNISQIYKLFGEFQEALRFYKDEAAIQKRSMGDTHPNVAITLSTSIALIPY
jgi:hypothetical protein